MTATTKDTTKVMIITIRDMDIAKATITMIADTDTTKGKLHRFELNFNLNKLRIEDTKTFKIFDKIFELLLLSGFILIKSSSFDFIFF